MSCFLKYSSLCAQNLGKVFPKLRRKGRGSTRNKKSSESNTSSNNDEEEEEPCDYVFRIIATFEKPDTICKF